MFRARAVSTTNVNDGYHPSASTWLTFVDVVRILRRFRHNKARRCCNLPARTETNRSPMATDVTRRNVARAVCVCVGAAKVDRRKRRGRAGAKCEKYAYGGRLFEKRERSPLKRREKYRISSESRKTGFRARHSCTRLTFA